jgi:predicted N-acetyltransferase YhbS
VAGLKIEYLKNNLDHARRLAELCARQWQHLYLDWDRTIALREFKSQRNDGTLPLSLVATQNEELVGMVSLIFDDLPGYEHLNWLTSLLVLPEHRKKGIGSRLVCKAERLFLLNGIPRAYLFTDSAYGFFEKLGWIVAESRTCNHYPIVVLEKEFGSNKRQHKL